MVELFGVTITGGTLAGSGGGIIETPSGTSTLSGVTIDDGSILQTSDGTFIDLESTTTINGTVTFEGGGTFMLDNPPDVASIVAGATGGTLDIAAGATLTGSGDIGNAGLTGATSLTLNNAGTIDAYGDGAAIDIDTGNTVTNTGTLEATCGGALEIDNSVNNYGATPGMIKASDDSSITLLGATVNSGTTTVGVGGGTIEADTGSTIEFDNVTTIGLGSSVSGGGGTLDAAGGTIIVNGATLDVGSTTAGGAGTVEASCDGSVDLNNVTINAAGATIEASRGGVITLTGGTLNDGSGTAGVAGGLVEATGCVSNITFEGTNTVDLGTTVAGGGGTAEATHGGAIIFDGSTVTDAGGTIEALHGGTVTFEFGSLDESSATAGIAGGAVEASGNCSTITFDNFTVKLDSAVAGGGGTIKASNGGAIVFNGGTINCAAAAPTSGGLIEALTCGTITFNSTNIYNQGSIIEADGIGAMILLAGAMIVDGTLETKAHGIIETVADSDSSSTLDGVTIANCSQLQVSHDTTLILNDGTTFTDGTLSILSSATLDVENGKNGGGGATLDGVNVTDNGALDVGDVASGAILSLDDGTTITGNGTGTLTINAKNTLDVEHGGNVGSGGATLDGVNVTDNGTLDIGDVNSGAILTLDDGTTITGNGTGKLIIHAGNTLDVEHGGNDGKGGATLDGVNVTDSGALDVGDLASGAILTLDDGTTITGNGTGTLTINADNTLDVEHGGSDGSGGADA